MSTLSKDRDILVYEPVLFGPLHLAGQALCQGDNGSLQGTCFIAEGQDLISAGVKAEAVVYLQTDDYTVDGAYEIVSVDSESQLTVSVLREDENSTPVQRLTSDSVRYRITTYQPQAQQVLFELSQYFGIRPGNADSAFSVDDIVEPSVLKQMSVYAVISAIYATLGSGDGKDSFWSKSLYYRKLFEKARERCRVSLDVYKDGVSERTSLGGSIRLVRD